MRIARARRQSVVPFLLAVLLLASSHIVALPPRRPPAPKRAARRAARLFSYDPSVALDVREESSRERDGARVRDISYAAYGSRRGRVKAYVVGPSEGTGPFAGILFFHWYGEVNGNRNEFLDEAVSLARQGTVSVLMQGFLPWSEQFTDAEADRRRIIEQTIEVRRALDLLLSERGVDARRVAFVGHDYGAMYGAIVSGTDSRVKACVLMAGMGSFADWSLHYWPATAARGEGVYREAMRELEPQLHVSRAAPAALLFQFSNDDKYIPKAAAEEFYSSASRPKEIRWYDAAHDLNLEAARADRRRWLMRQLRLAVPR